MPNIQSGGAVSLPEAYEIKALSCDEVSHTGDTNETQLKKYTIPAGLIGSNGAIRFRIAGKSSGNLDEKYIRLKLGGSQAGFMTAIAQVSTLDWMMDGVIYNNSAENSQKAFHRSSYDDVLVDTKTAQNTSVDTTAEVDIEVTGQLLNAADSIGINEFSIEIYSN